MLECSKEKMRTSIHYSCDCPSFMPDDTIATIISSNESIALCDLYWKFDRSMEESVGIFIHEATHLCGTGDEAYFEYPDYP